MTEQIQGRLTAEVVFETPGPNFSNTKGYGISSLKGCVKSAKNSNFHIEVFDENGQSRGFNSVGDPYDPSPEMLAIIEAIKLEYLQGPEVESA